MSTNKIIHLAITEEEVEALNNMASSLHELGLDSVGESALVAKVWDKISNAYYNG